MIHRALATVVSGLLLTGAPTPAVERIDIPADAPNDAVMADSEAVREISTWVGQALLNQAPPAEVSGIQVTLRRQDYATLHYNQSCMDTALRIGQQSFTHGLGTHANSEIVLAFPPGAKTFKAYVGIDNNYDTRGANGSVQFSVEIGGRESYRSRTLKGSDEAAPVEVALPPGTRELVLKVDTTPDGPACDQADWADAQIIMDNGTSLRPHGPDSWIDTAIPFSFTYGGKEARALLKTWTPTATRTDETDRVRHQVTWTDPETQLQVTAAATCFKRYPAVDWVLTFQNQGPKDTPIIEDIQAVDTVLQTAAAKQSAILHRLTGDNCNDQSFLPYETPVDSGKTLSLAPAGGRPSNTSAFPFFNYEYAGRGLLVGIGWSGQWAASFDRAPAGPTRFRAGMEKTHLVLHPGEKIRSPRVLLMPWKGDRVTAHQRFRRLLLFCYTPKLETRPLQLPFALQCFDRYFGTRPDWSTEAGQIAAASATHAIGCDYHWFDAGWFLRGFPNGVGNWFCDPVKFPHGLKPVSDTCHQLGNKFILWFEPERVAKDSQIANEHPEFVFGGKDGGLFKLNDPAARQWLAALLETRIEEYGVDVYRNDFNIDPLSYWRANDPPDRQGMTEIRYVEGLYALWDRLLARFPGLWIDNCASGGRRIDLETLLRSVPLWRSDTSCWAGHADWDQVQAQGLSLYIPLSTACSWTTDAYTLRSSATGGAILQFDYLDKNFSLDQARTGLAEIKENAKYWYGDFIPLTPASVADDQWAAYQFHRPDRNAGVVYAFRRGASPYLALSVDLRSIDPSGNYAVEFIDEARQRIERKIPGRELANGFELRLPQKRTSLVVRYRLLAQ